MAGLVGSVDPNTVEDPSELSDWRLPLSFMKPRHNSLSTEEDSEDSQEQAWRKKDRMKTWSVALVLCLNIGVDPPDVVKTNPCARKECWVDSLSTAPQKALEEIGNSLQKQYERWQPRARYKQLLDPTTDDVRKLCMALRKNAKTERVLFHYNGHGVPKPTTNGEIWVFNKNYTQYIPLSIYDLQAWMGSPSIYVYDCSHAGLILESFRLFACQRDTEFFMEMNGGGTYCVGLLENCIQLAACGPNDVLPMHPSLPADLFTSCLTTPIKTALLWYCYSRVGKLSLVGGITPEIIDKIPGRLNDRRTPLGELNWIFTAITDTIAWNTVPKDLFQRLFRQDLLVASLFRNFLLAERVMRSYKCTPESHPSLPSTYNHPMWAAWDLALDHIVRQLPDLVEKKATYESSQFFAQQLAAFQVWLINCSNSTTPPQQLPIVLQFLLSQAHRLQALELLGRFLDMGPWAVHAALNVGIFPYVLKLLGSKLRELQPILVFIWSKILAVDPSCQADLIKDGGYKYFIQILADSSMQYEYRTMAAFVLAVIVHNNSKGQEVALQNNVISLCLSQLEEPNPLLKQWLAVCLGRLWTRYEAARWCGVRDSAHEKLYPLLWHEIPDVRAAGVYALGTYMLNSVEGGSAELAFSIDHAVGSTLLGLLNDGSPVVRLELVTALHSLIQLYEKQFQMAALRSTESDRGITNLSTSVTPSGWIHVSIDPLEVETSFEEPSAIGASKQISSHTSRTMPNGSLVESPPTGTSYSSLGGDDRKGIVGSPIAAAGRTVHASIWKGLVFLASDPCPEVAEHAQFIVHNVHDKLRQKSVARSIGVTLVNSMSAPTSPNVKEKSATLGPSTIRNSQRPTIAPSSSTQEFRGDPGISLPKQLSAATMSLPSSAVHLSSRRAVFGRGGMPVTEEDAESTSSEYSITESHFTDWCSKYFAHPLMKQPEDCDPASVPYQEREFRFIRNHTIRSESDGLCRSQMRSKLADQLFVSKESNNPQLLMFHPYLPQLAVMGKQSWSIWDIDEAAKVGSSYNSPAVITTGKFINPHDITFLLLGTEDGAVHVWRDYTEAKPKLVTAWRALTDMLPSSRNAGMVVEWEQSSGLLMAGGDSRVIRVWDTHKELNVQDIATGADACVSCLTSDTSDRSLLVAGCGDGNLRLYDKRLSAHKCLVGTLREHKSWVVNVSMQQHSANQHIVSCSVDGDVRLWDPRFTKSIKSIPGVPGSANVCEVHPRVPLLASASQQGIRILNLETDDTLNNIRYHEGFMGQRLGATRCMAFHPNRVWLAAGGTDGLITVYSTERKKN